MKSVALLLVLLVAAAGCQTDGLPYTPAEGVGIAPVSADRHLTQDRLYVYVDTRGWRVESAVLVNEDGRELPAAQILRPKPGISRSVGGNARVGVATGSLRRSQGIGLGVGVGSSSGSDTQNGQTVAFFPADQAGPGPWLFRVQVGAFPVTEISLPATAPIEQ